MSQAGSEKLYYTKHSYGNREATAAAEVITGGWVSQGPALAEFERALAAWCHVPTAVAVSSGTMALYVGLRALGVGPGDEVILPSLTFLATGSAALMCGAAVKLADSGEDLNITLAEVERLAGPKTRAVVPVHFAGFPCPDLPGIHKHCRERGISVLEDAAHALGGRYGEDPVGSCTYSDAAAFSFHPAKAICTGEGGAVTTRDPLVEGRLRLARNHGMVKGDDPEEGPWHLELIEPGINARLSDILAAIGTVQLTRLPAFLDRRREIARAYLEAFADLPGLLLPQEVTGLDSAWNLFILRTKGGKPARERLAATLQEAGVVPTVHYTPLHRQRPYIEAGAAPPDGLPVTDRIYESSVTLPLYPDLAIEDQDRVITAVRRWATEN